MSIRSLTTHSPSMDSHNLLNWAHQFFKHLFIQLGKNNLPQLTSVLLSIVAVVAQWNAHQSIHKMILLLMVAARGQLTTSGCCRCHSTIFVLSPTFKIYINVPGLFGQPNIANILSWHYLWDPYGGFGHDGRRIQPALPSLPSSISKILPVWDNFRTFTHF